MFVRDGNIPNNISLTEGDSLYAPEQNVLAWGTERLQASGTPAGPLSSHREGMTKTIRKMMKEDRLFLVTISSFVGGMLLDGGIQFFLMS